MGVKTSGAHTLASSCGRVRRHQLVWIQGQTIDKFVPFHLIAPMIRPSRAIRFVAALSLLLAIFSSNLVGANLRVRSNASPGGNGSTWPTAFTNLQDALAAAVAGDRIYLAEGTYTPDIGTGQTSGDVNAFFALKEGVEIYGGFPSGGGPFADRDPVANPTILSADLGSVVLADVLVEARELDATTLVEGLIIRDAEAGAVRIVDASPVFRNCVFRNNSNPGEGGAIRITDQSNPSFFNCDFIENSTVGSNMVGGAVSLGASGASFEDCLFEDNSSGSDGGAVYMNSFFATPAVFTRCEFVANSSGRQGGAFAAFDGNQTFNDCRFEGNTSSIFAEIVFSQDSTTNFSDCEFILGPPTSASQTEGFRFRGTTSTIERSTFTNPSSAIVVIRANPSSSFVSDLTVINSSFDGNAAAIDFTGESDGTSSDLIIRNTSFENHSLAGVTVVRASDTNVELTDSQLVNNAGDGLNVILSNANPSTFVTTVTGTRFENNERGMSNDSSELVVEDCQFIANASVAISVNSDTATTTIRGSEFSNNLGSSLSSGSAGDYIIEDCTFSGNSSSAINFRGDSLEVSNSTFRGNSASIGSGGAQMTASTAMVSFLNCLFSGNQSNNGGSAVFADVNQLSFVNCTFSGNATGDEGTILIDGGDAFFKNTLVYLNISGYPEDSSDLPSSSIKTDFNYADTLTFERSMIDNFSKADLDALSTTFDNFDSFDPRFVNSLNPFNAPSTAGDFRLSDDSPAINVGSNLAYTNFDSSATPEDLAGDPRITEQTIELGAYEFTPNPFTRDPDFDGIPTGVELAIGTNPNLYDLNDPKQFKQTGSSPETFTFGYDVASASTIILELKRSTDLINFDVIVATSETGFPTANGAGLTTITDPNPPAGKAFYRLEAREK